MERELLDAKTAREMSEWANRTWKESLETVLLKVREAAESGAREAAAQVKNADVPFVRDALTELGYKHRSEQYRGSDHWCFSVSW